MTPARGPRRRRLPNWVLAAIVAALLSGSVALFVLDAMQEDPAPAPAAADRERTNDDGELILPDSADGDPTDPRRRSELGRDRREADGDDAVGEGDGATGDGADDEQLAVLDGKTIALVPADATTVAGSGASRPERVGTLRLPCAPSGTPAALTRQRELLDALATRLRAAGARVVRVDDARGAVPCVGTRSASLERADLALVLGTSQDEPAAIAARVAGRVTAADTARTRRLVDALGAEVGVDVVHAARGERVDLLDEHGVVDRPGGAAVAWLALGDASDDLDASRVAGSIAAGLAGALQPAAPARATPRPTPTRPTAPVPSVVRPVTPTPGTSAPSSPPATTSPAPTPATPGTSPTPSTPGGNSSGPESDD